MSSVSTYLAITYTLSFLGENRRRIRYVCPHCKQSLAHATYCKQENDSSSASDSTFDFSEPSSPTLDCSILSSVELDDKLSSSETESSCSSDSDSAPEVWKGSDLSSSESENENGRNDQTALQYMFCVFLSFFELTFHISDRALAYLLSFLSALFSYFSSQIENAPALKMFSNNCPRTIYSMRKALNVKKLYKTYVACPHCHHSYNA